MKRRQNLKYVSTVVIEKSSLKNNLSKNEMFDLSC